MADLNILQTQMELDNEQQILMAKVESFHKELEDIAYGRYFATAYNPFTRVMADDAVGDVLEHLGEVEFVHTVLKPFEQDFFKEMQGGKLTPSEISRFIDAVTNPEDEIYQAKILEELKRQELIWEFEPMEYLTEFDNIRHAFDKFGIYDSVEIIKEEDEPFVYLDFNGSVKGYWGEDEFELPLTTFTHNRIIKAAEQLYDAVICERNRNNTQV